MVSKLVNGQRVVMSGVEVQELEASRSITDEQLKLAVTNAMIERQDAGILFNSLPVATDAQAVADISGAKQKARASRKVVPRKGNGARAELSSAQFDELFDAIETYRQAVMDHAYDLLEQIEAGQSPDISSGWPDNVF